MPAPVQIRPGGPEDLDRLEPLWVSVHHRHAESMPELAPYVDDATTWAERRALYAELLAKPDTVLLLATADDALVGYGLAHVMPAEETVGRRHLGHRPADRGDRVAGRAPRAPRPRARHRAARPPGSASSARQGVTDLVIGVLPGNAGAVRMYERRGYRPTWMYLSRFDGR